MEAVYASVGAKVWNSGVSCDTLEAADGAQAAVPVLITSFACRHRDYLDVMPTSNGKRVRVSEPLGAITATAVHEIPVAMPT